MGIKITAFAKELDCAPSSITRIIKRGMPTLPDRTLERASALNFLARQTSGGGGGWAASSRHGKPSLQERAAALLGIEGDAIADLSELSFLYSNDQQAGDHDRQIRRKLMDAILSKRNLIPGILAQIGVNDPVFLHCADDLFSALVVEFAGDLDPIEWTIEDQPLVNTDIKSVFRRLKIRLTKQIVEQADKMADLVNDVTQKALEPGK